MKVLWFCNTACSASEKLGLNYHLGGWLTSLQKSLKKHAPDLELGISFISADELDYFEFDSCIFFPIHQKFTNTKALRFLRRLYDIKDEKDIMLSMLKIIEFYKPDIIHIHGTEQSFGMIQKFVKIPTVVSIQGLINPYVIKFYSGISKEDTSKNESIINKFFLKSQKFHFEVFQRKAEKEVDILKISKYVIGRTDWDRRITNIFSPSRTYFHNDEILRSAFYERKWSKNWDLSDEGSFKIVTTIGNSLYKGFEVLVQTVMLLVEFTNLKFEWTVIGVNYKSETVNIIKEYLDIDYDKLPINLVGSKDDKMIIDIVLESNLYCQVSHIENSPNSICEAMLLGIPVIASNAGGTSSLLNNGIEGILIQDGDPFSLSGAIVETINNYDKAIKMAEMAKAKANERHNVLKNVTDLVKIYNKVIDQNVL